MCVFSLYKSSTCHISISGLFDLMILNTGTIFTKFELGQPVRS